MNDPTQRERLARGFSQLPEFEPPPAAWQAIEARLDAPRRAPRGGALALGVAGLAAIAVALRLAAPPPVAPAEPAAVRSTVAAAAEDPLDRRSSDLEGLLAALPPARSARASTGFTTTLLEDRIALVDERLSEPEGIALSAEATLALKRQRLVLLDSLVRVKYASAVVASL